MARVLPWIEAKEKSKTITSPISSVVPKPLEEEDSFLRGFTNSQSSSPNGSPQTLSKWTPFKKPGTRKPSGRMVDNRYVRYCCCCFFLNMLSNWVRN
jgi:hypothetical protein